MRALCGDVRVTVYAHYRHAWAAQCLARSVRLDEANAFLELAKYRLDLAQKTYDGGADQLEDLQLRQSQTLRAAAEVSASKELLDTCREGEPSLEFLEGLTR